MSMSLLQSLNIRAEIVRLPAVFLNKTANQHKHISAQPNHLIAS